MIFPSSDGGYPKSRVDTLFKLKLRTADESVSFCPCFPSSYALTECG